MRFCGAFKKFLTLFLAAILSFAPTFGAFADDEISDVIYGIYDWKKGENQYLLPSLEVNGGNDWYARAVGDFGISDDTAGYLARLEAYVGEKYSSEGGT